MEIKKYLCRYYDFAWVTQTFNYSEISNNLLIKTPLSNLIIKTPLTSNLPKWSTILCYHPHCNYIFRTCIGLRVFGNRILRRIFGPKRDENGECRPLHNEDLHNLYRSPHIVRVIKSRRLRWAGLVAEMEESRRAFKFLTGKPTGERPLGRSRLRWEDNIRMDLKEIDISTRIYWFGSG